MANFVVLATGILIKKYVNNFLLETHGKVKNSKTHGNTKNSIEQILQLTDLKQHGC